MGWTKTKIVLVAAGLTLATGAIAILIHEVSSRPGENTHHRLADGSVLALDRVLVGSQIRIAHGTPMAKILGSIIPSNGVHLLSINLNRQTQQDFESGGKSVLVAEFSLSGSNAAIHPLVKPAFFRQFRFVIYGESGIEFVEELSGGNFRSYPDGYYGYVVARRFPRDSHWLGFRIEKRETQDQGGPWQNVADLKMKNPARAAIQPWMARSLPTTNSSGGLDFVLSEVTVEAIPYMPRDIWNHVVTPRMQVLSNGVLLANWAATYGYVQAEDASGNWDSLASHRSLDPKYVWKLEADFEPQSNFSAESLLTVELRDGSGTIITNVMNVPLTVSWNANWIDANIPTNQPNLALKFVAAADNEGQKVYDGNGGWGQYMFRKGSFMIQKEGHLTTDFKPTQVTVAVVTNIHTTFYTQPRLLDKRGKVK